MTSHTYTMRTRKGTEKVDVCSSCRRKLGLPTTISDDGIRVSENRGSLYRDDPCFGCGGPASGFADRFGYPFDGEEDILTYNLETRTADAIATMLTHADALDVYATTDAPTEEVVVGETDEGEAFAKFVRQSADGPADLHVTVLNDDEDDREQMEERCRKLCRLLTLNGWDGAPHPVPDGGDFPDWEIIAVRADD